MGALWIVVITFVGYIVAYHTYGRFLARKIFRLDDRRTPPAVALEDGVDYVPTRKGVIFGHHYTSIAGTGPIVGPAIGIIWGWVPALIWIFVGSIVMGAVHDFGSLVVSMRNEGKSLSEITGRYVSRRARTIFFGIVFLELLIVIAVFGVVIAAVFAKFPQSVFPVWCEVPIAVLLGLAVYRWKQNVALATAAAVAAMYVTVVIGHFLPLSMPALGFAASGGEGAGAYVASGTLTPPAVWIIILLAYAYIASSIPVTALLQPRDYINAWELFIAMGLLIAGVVGAALSGGLEIVAPRFQAHPVGAPPIWPFLFVTIACGAISGFHCLVASGTTPKQLRTERDSLFVGYGSMLMEAALATVVVVAVAAGIGMAYETDTGQVLSGTAAWQHHYASWKAAGGLDSKIAAVVVGAGNMIGTLGVPKALGIVIMGVFIASFAGTTLDTATRIQRYVISELAGGWKLKPLANRWVATAVAVLSAGALAFAASPPGKLGAGAMTLWPMFGAVNQLLAALALLLITIYLKRHHPWGWWLTFVPCVGMLVMTLWAIVYNEVNFLRPAPAPDGTPGQVNWSLVVLNGLTLLLALGLVAESIVVLRRRQGTEPAAAGEPAPATGPRDLTGADQGGPAGGESVG